MSVAFTKEEDGEAAAADLPDRPISPRLNLVTAEGLALLDAELEKARSAYAVAQAGGDVRQDRTAMARATRDLRYYAARRASAQLRTPEAGVGGVQFGSRVVFERQDGRRQGFRIVGEDEADPPAAAFPMCRRSRGRCLDVRPARPSRSRAASWRSFR